MRWQISLQTGDIVSYDLSERLEAPVVQPGQLSIPAIGDEISLSGVLQPAKTTLTCSNANTATSRMAKVRRGLRKY